MPDVPEDTCGESSPVVGDKKCERQFGKIRPGKARSDTTFPSQDEKKEVRKSTREKAEASFDTTALVSALLAGFQLEALSSVELCSELPTLQNSTAAAMRSCSWEESGFIVSASISMVVAMLSLVMVTIEYQGILAELGAPLGASDMIAALSGWGRLARYLNYTNIMMFLFTTTMLVRVRFGAATSSVGVKFATAILGVGIGLVFVVIVAMTGLKTVVKAEARSRIQDAGAQVGAATVYLRGNLSRATRVFGTSRKSHKGSLLSSDKRSHAARAVSCVSAPADAKTASELSCEGVHL
jgi:hypothetical protein